jgi:hypothetical protein
MKIFIIIFLLFFTIGCNSNKIVYWCGDHACINKKEKEAYFKKTMIVETKEIIKRKNKDLSNLEKIKKNEGIISQEELNQEVKLNEKNNLEDVDNEKDEKEILVQARLEEKNRIKNEKLLAKQAKIDERNRIKNEKLLTKQAKLDEENRIKNEKNLVDQIDLEEKEINKKKKIDTGKVVLNEEGKSYNSSFFQFNEIVNSIYKKNIEKSYPDINDTPK